MMFRPDRVLKDRLRSKFLITTHEGATWEAVLFDADEFSLLLKGAANVSADGTRTPADGEVIIPRTDVAYLQRL